MDGSTDGIGRSDSRNRRARAAMALRVNRNRALEGPRRRDLQRSQILRPPVTRSGERRTRLGRGSRQSLGRPSGAPSWTGRCVFCRSAAMSIGRRGLSPDGAQQIGAASRNAGYSAVSSRNAPQLRFDDVSSASVVAMKTASVIPPSSTRHGWSCAYRSSSSAASRALRTACCSNAIARSLASTRPAPTRRDAAAPTSRTCCA